MLLELPTMSNPIAGIVHIVSLHRAHGNTTAATRVVNSNLGFQHTESARRDEHAHCCTYHAHRNHTPCSGCSTQLDFSSCEYTVMSSQARTAKTSASVKNTSQACTLTNAYIRHIANTVHVASTAKRCVAIYTGRCTSCEVA